MNHNCLKLNMHKIFLLIYYSNSPVFWTTSYCGFCCNCFILQFSLKNNSLFYQSGGFLRFFFKNGNHLTKYLRIKGNISEYINMLSPILIF